jgi:hypothetical protein
MLLTVIITQLLADHRAYVVRRNRNRLLTWARSEGLEPPTFGSVEICTRVRYQLIAALICGNATH